ncbi:MAG TPA: oxygenase MpaB family protein, partial [Solirubrobacterales bacterium]|nr:oxygenase MpaB family protein [Solirubrobacterales bacterium]
SVSWELHSDVSAVAIAGVGSILMELLHPSVMAGVGLQSNYREQPYRRARTTFGWVITTTFGSTSAAEQLIARVKRMHSRVSGIRPDGEPYRALDPELIAWVHSCIPWGVMTAYERFNRPLSVTDKDRYLAEQSVIALKSGADEVPTTVADLEAFVEDMRPKLEVTDLTREFFDFLLTGPLGAMRLPGPLNARAQRFQVESGMSLMPRWAQEMTGFDRPEMEQRLLQAPSLHSYARALRWAMGTPPWRALADERVGEAATARRTTAPRLTGAAAGTA